MTHTALIKLAPVANRERTSDPAWKGRTMLWRTNSLQLLPRTEGVPLLLDHNPESQLGQVEALFPLEWHDGAWVCCRATLTDPPSILKAGRTRASFGRHGVHEHDDRITQAFVSEVSLLVATEPLEPRAELVSLRRIESTTAARAVEIPSTGQPIRRPSIGQVLAVR